MKIAFNHNIFIVTIALLALSVPFSATAEKLTLAEGINKADKQRMLTQRMLKAYCQMGMELRYRKSEKQLHAAIDLFDSQLDELQQFGITNDINTGLAKVRILWAGVKEAVTSKATKEDIEQLRADAEQLLNASHEVTLMLQNLSGTPQDKLIGIAGRQRMLSQRISSLYLMQAWGFEKEPYLTDFQTAIDEFDSALKLLKEAPENTQKISDALEEATLQWGIVRHSIEELQQEKKYIPVLIIRSADKILSQMNAITGMYAMLPSK